MIRQPPRSTPLYSSAASDVYKRQGWPRSRLVLLFLVGGGDICEVGAVGHGDRTARVGESYVTGDDDTRPEGPVPGHVQPLGALQRRCAGREPGLEVRDPSVVVRVEGDQARL